SSIFSSASSVSWKKSRSESRELKPKYEHEIIADCNLTFITCPSPSSSTSAWSSSGVNSVLSPSAPLGDSGAPWICGTSHVDSFPRQFLQRSATSIPCALLNLEKVRK